MTSKKTPFSRALWSLFRRTQAPWIEATVTPSTVAVRIEAGILAQAQNEEAADSLRGTDSIRKEGAPMAPLLFSFWEFARETRSAWVIRCARKEEPGVPWTLTWQHNQSLITATGSTLGEALRKLEKRAQRYQEINADMGVLLPWLKETLTPARTSKANQAAADPASGEPVTAPSGRGQKGADEAKRNVA